MARPKTKTTTTTVKLTPQVRAAWEAAAARDHRSLSNMLEVLILEWCERHAIQATPVAVPASIVAASTSTKPSPAARKRQPATK